MRRREIYCGSWTVYLLGVMGVLVGVWNCVCIAMALARIFADAPLRIASE